MASHDKDGYFAKLAEQAERYDEMASYVRAGGIIPGANGPHTIDQATCRNIKGQAEEEDDQGTEGLLLER